MSGMQVIGWFTEWLDKNARPDAIYRGHGNAGWPVTPSAFRPEQHGITDKGRLLGWRSMAGRFANPLPRNDMEWLVLAQHYGIATPLLDWSTNPMVALFFACEATEADQGCVIQCDRSAFMSFNKPETVEPFKANRLIPALIDATVMNTRTLAQDSVMSVHTEIAPVMRFEESQSERFFIDAGWKGGTLLALERLGFTAERLFGDLATVARNFKERLRLDDAFAEPISDIRRQESDEDAAPDFSSVARRTTT